VYYVDFTIFATVFHNTSVFSLRQELQELEELVVLAEPPELDVLAPAVVEVLEELVELEEAILAQLEVLLAARLVNPLAELPQHVLLGAVVLPQEDWLVLAELAEQVSVVLVAKPGMHLAGLAALVDEYI
jgi:hypothetical protein